MTLLATGRAKVFTIESHSSKLYSLVLIVSSLGKEMILHSVHIFKVDCNKLAIHTYAPVVKTMPYFGVQE